MIRLPILLPLLMALLSGCGTFPLSSSLTGPAGHPTARSADGVETAVRAYFKNKFDWLDKDRSGEVSKQEAVDAGMAPEGFDATDANHDGKLTFQEFGPEYAVKSIVEAIRQTAAAEFARMDRNGDRLLSGKEMENAVALPFDDCDVNRDGKVTLSEFEDLLAQKSAMLK